MLLIVLSPYRRNDGEASRSKVTGPRIYYLTALAKDLFYGFAGDRTPPASLIVGDPTIYEKYWKQVGSSQLIQVALSDDLNPINMQLCHTTLGDPTVYESYWKKLGDLSISIPCSQSLSYFADEMHMCWIVLPKLEEEIRVLHKAVGNAVVDGRHIVVGTGSSQLIQAALYAHSITLNKPHPIDVVAAAPHYSTYKEQIDLLQSRLFKWSGDAHAFDKDEAYVTSPNNPDGLLRQPVVNKANGIVMYDLAYFWPQYTAITSCLDHDIMLFTLSKCTGHAGSRIGWAVVKDEEVAKKMVKFMMVSTIGVSKEAQIRAASLLEVISGSCQPPYKFDNFFECSRLLMAERWNKLKEAIIKNEELLRSPEFPLNYCNFAKKDVEPYPAFAWLKCADGIDCAKMMKEHKVLTWSGAHFGCGIEFTRLSMVGRDEEFGQFLKRLPAILDGMLAARDHN